MYTYRELISKYSDDVNKGYADRDLTPRQRRVCHVMLNIASNATAGYAYYPPSDQTRDDVVKHLQDVVWDGKWLAYAMAPRSEDDFDTAYSRAIDILRNM